MLFCVWGIEGHHASKTQELIDWNQFLCWILFLKSFRSERENKEDNCSHFVFFVQFEMIKAGKVKAIRRQLVVECKIFFLIKMPCIQIRCLCSCKRSEKRLDHFVFCQTSVVKWKALLSVFGWSNHNNCSSVWVIKWPKEFTVNWLLEAWLV